MYDLSKCDKHTKIIKLAQYYIENKSTLRETAKYFNISKSTVHLYLSKLLIKINRSLYSEYNEIAKYNQSMKHIRGGQATRNKYKKEIL